MWFENQQLSGLAIAHDALVYRGGAERVVGIWAQRWPGVPIYTSAYLPDATYDVFRQADVRTSFVQRLAFSPGIVMRGIFPLMIPGFRRFDFSRFDVVLSSASYAAKAIRVPRGVCHLCYCYTPLRLAWRPDDYLLSASPARAAALRLVASILRPWDYEVAQGVFAYAATCRNVAARIKACYGREAQVIYAPVELARYRIGKPDGYYLVVSRLNSYKRIDLAIEATRRLGRPLVIVGEGPQRAGLESLARGADVRFVGRVTDQELLDLYTGCRALLFPQEEDYGLAPLEVQASGRPVVAYARGGALETVVDGETGVLFSEQDPEALVEAVLKAESIKFDPISIRRHAARFDVDTFCRSFEDFIQRNRAAYTAGRTGGCRDEVVRATAG
jgi:glycosyltransferase involved in cell wall biosynthesis